MKADTLMPHDIHGIDHTIIGVENLEVARAQYQKLGFTLTPRGSHIGWGTANYCIMLDEDYIELLGIVDPSIETNGLDEALADQGEGLLGLALATQNPEETRRSLEVAGLNPSELLDLKRKLELPEGDVLPKFKIVRVTAGGLNEKQLFIVHHQTPELLRRSEWESHANGAKQITSVAFVVDDPESLADYYRTFCGALNVTLTDDTLTVRTGKATLVFIKERDLELLYPGLDFAEDLAPSPSLFAMSVGVSDLKDTEAYLRKAAVPVRSIANGSLRVNPEHCCGTLIEFVQL